MRRVALLLILTIVLLLALAGVALAHSQADTDAIQGILASYRSPLPWWTIDAFAASHPEFDIAGYLAVVWAESSLGKSCDYKCNPGSIKGGPVGRIWRDLRIGTSPRGYNVYRNMYEGQRAVIRLIYDADYNTRLAAHDWWGFANRYYGRNVPGISGYVANLRAAHARVVKMAAAYGATW